jgi:hypothetical protein
MRRIVAFAVALLGLPLLGYAQQVLYITSGNGNQSTLYRVDPATMAATAIGPVLISGSPVAVTGLAEQPGTGLLYGVTGSEYSPSRVLFTIDPTTAATTIIGTIGAVRLENASDITFTPDGTLYGWTVRGGPLAAVDPNTAARLIIGSGANGTGGNGLASNAAGILYLAGPTAPGSLYTVDRTTGALTAVALLTGVPSPFGNINAMAFDASGTLYATSTGSNQLVTINTTTGAISVVGLLPFGEADALAFVGIPEPGTYALIAAGLALLCACRRRFN